MAEAKLDTGVNERVRDVRQGPDGWLYVLTDGKEGRLVRLETFQAKPTNDQGGPVGR